jgi:hypothetical protein
MATEIDLHATELLERLYACRQAGTNTEEAESAYIAELGKDPEYGYQLLEFLASLGYVNATTYAGGVEGEITVQGMHAVQKLQADRADPKVRSGMLRAALLLWLDEQEERDDAPADWDLFVEAQPPTEDGGYSKRQISHAAEYLYEHGLIQAVKVSEFADGWIRPTLTVGGRTCVTDFGGEVAEYLNRGQARPAVTNRSTTTNTVHISDNHGNLSVAGEHITQNINHAGFDVAQILELAGGVHQIAPVLKLGADDERQLIETADELHAEADSDKPDRGRLRQLINRIYEGLKKAAPTVGQKAVLALADEAIKALTR